jgi:hypothetical protein
MMIQEISRVPTLGTRFITRDAPVDLSLRVATLAQREGAIEAVLSSGVDVRRANFIERLGQWNELPKRVPLVDSHQHNSVNNVIGYVDSLRNDNGTIRGPVHLSESHPDIAAKSATVVSTASLSVSVFRVGPRAQRTACGCPPAGIVHSAQPPSPRQRP